MRIDEILLKPVLTEKGTNLANNKEYLFETHIKANKNNIKEALEKLYKVKVKQVKVMIRKGKTRRVGRKMVSKKLANRKIAFIKLSSGDINLFPKA